VNNVNNVNKSGARRRDDDFHELSVSPVRGAVNTVNRFARRGEPRRQRPATARDGPALVIHSPRSGYENRPSSRRLFRSAAGRGTNRVIANACEPFCLPRLFAECGKSEASKRKRTIRRYGLLFVPPSRNRTVARVVLFCFGFLPGIWGRRWLTRLLNLSLELFDLCEHPFPNRHVEVRELEPLFVNRFRNLLERFDCVAVIGESLAQLALALV
jgi:hypothetical protein